MDELLYSASDQRLRQEVREFTRREVTPVALKADALAEAPEAVYRKFFETGLLHGYIPSSLGGRDHTAVATTVVSEELAFGCLAIASALVVPILPVSMVLSGGTPAQKERWLRPLSERFSLPAIACTEAGAGSDLRATRTVAVREGNHYRITGEKAFVSNLPYADSVVVLARTDGIPRPGSRRSLSAFIVPRDAAGLEIGPRWRTVGLRSLAVCSLSLKGVGVPEDQRIGEEGDGLSLLNNALDISRTMMGSYAVGASRRVIDELFRHARERSKRGDKLLHSQDYRFRLVALEEDVATGRALTWLAARKHDAGLKSTKESSLAKLHGGKICSRVSHEAALMLAGTHSTAAAVVEKFRREAPAISIIEGPEPIQKEIIFAEMLRRGSY